MRRLTRDEFWDSSMLSRAVDTWPELDSHHSLEPESVGVTEDSWNLPELPSGVPTTESERLLQQRSFVTKVG